MINLTQSGNSVAIPIALIGVIAGIWSAMDIYLVNLVGRVFNRFRPIALAIGNLGSPVGSLVFPYLASGLQRGLDRS